MSGDKFHFDIPVRPADKGDGHTNRLMVVLQSELLHHLDGQHVHLQLRKPPPNAHPRAEAERNGSEGMRSVLTRTSAQPALRLELLWFGEVLLVVHGQQVPVGDHCPAGDLVAAKHHVLGRLPVQTRDCWLHPLTLVHAGFEVPHPFQGRLSHLLVFANHVLNLLVKLLLDLWMSGKVIEQEVFPVVSIPAVIASMAITAGIWES